MTRFKGRFSEAMAYAFRSPLSLAQMLERLNERSGRSWSMVNSDSAGEYIGSALWGDDDEDYKNRLRVLADGDGYVLAIYLRSFRPTAEQEWSELLSYARDELLSLLEAVDVRQAADDYTS